MVARTITRPRLEAVQRQQERPEQSVDPTDEKGQTSSDVPVIPPVPQTPEALQRHMLLGSKGENKLNVILLIDGSDADGIREYHEALPLSVIRGILDPNVKDFFIPIAGTARTKPPRTKGHFLHTSYIREVILMDALPEEEEV